MATIGFFSTAFKYLYSSFSFYWCTAPLRPLNRSLGAAHRLISKIQRYNKCCCQSACQDAPPLQLGVHRRFASGSTHRSVHAYKTARFPCCSSTHSVVGFSRSETCRPLPAFYASFNLSNPVSLFPMAVRGVVCVQQRNS